MKATCPDNSGLAEERPTCFCASSTNSTCDSRCVPRLTDDHCYTEQTGYQSGCLAKDTRPRAYPWRTNVKSMKSKSDGMLLTKGRGGLLTAEQRAKLSKTGL
jgi:hypothetical protein